jgi:hypothetical protein
VTLRAAAICLALFALLAGSCGGDDGGGGDESATELLDRGFATDVDTGRLTFEAEVTLNGVPRLGGPLRLELEGPFRSRGPTRLPDLDMSFRATGMGAGVEGQLVLLPENAWIEYGGETYEVGEELWSRVKEAFDDGEGPGTFAEAKLDPLDWVEDLETGGEREVGGVRATEVTGKLDVERMLDAFNDVAGKGERLSRETLDQIDDYVRPVEFAAWIGEDDIWRRVTAEVDFVVPEGQRDSVGGLSGGHLSLDMLLEDPNEPVEIEGRDSGRPISELLSELGIPPESLLGPGFAVPEPG